MIIFMVQRRRGGGGRVCEILIGENSGEFGKMKEKVLTCALNF